MANERLSIPGFQVDNINAQFPNPGLIAGFVFALYSSAARGGVKVIDAGVLEEDMTIAAAATSDSAANLLPANSLIVAVNGFVRIAIPTAATFIVGDATQTSRFATGVAVAQGTSFVQNLQWNPTVASANLGLQQGAAAKIRITPNLTPANNSGRVALTIGFITFAAPTA